MKLKLLISIALSAAAIAGMPAKASEPNLEMEKLVQQLRATAQRMRGQLPADQIAEMLRNADELESEAKAGSFVVLSPSRAAPGITAHIEQEHGSIHEWLARTATCAGYQWETWRTATITTGPRVTERNTGCKRAFAFFEQYFYAQRNGRRGEARRLLADYDRAAHEVVNADRSQ